ncbi:MAG: MFS transporter [Vicinamibacteria bacterium]|nr:MFS transporter [Vicinamibacteria bacterium]
MADERSRLFHGRFFAMCGFSFVVFLSAFQLLPAAPFHIRALGGSWLLAGLYLGCLTYASAFTAPFTGALADRMGRKRMLVIAGLALCVLSLAYACAPRPWVILALAVVHGAFWSGLLSASAAYTGAIVPAGRRAEGMGYWGLASVAAMSMAPNIGLWILDQGWIWLCAETAALHAAMTLIAMRLPEAAPERRERHRGARSLVEWRVLGAAMALFLVFFGYGAVTSFVAPYARASGVSPAGLFFTFLALGTVVTRPFISRLADRVGYEKIIAPCLLLIAVGLVLLAFGGTRPWLIASATVFAVGLGSVYPVFSAYVFSRVPDDRHGAAFGSVLAAFDTGIGTGSIACGYVVGRHGFSAAFGTAAAVAALSLPCFLLVGRRLLRRDFSRDAG